MEDRELLQEYKDILDIASRTLVILERQAAAYTFLSMPPELKTNLEEQRRKANEYESKIANLELRLTREGYEHRPPEQLLNRAEKKNSQN